MIRNEMKLAFFGLLSPPLEDLSNEGGRIAPCVYVREHDPG